MNNGDRTVAVSGAIAVLGIMALLFLYPPGAMPTTVHQLSANPAIFAHEVVNVPGKLAIAGKITLRFTSTDPSDIRSLVGDGAAPSVDLYTYTLNGQDGEKVTVHSMYLLETGTTSLTGTWQDRGSGFQLYVP